MTTDKTPTEALAQLRHLYAQLKSQDGMSRTDRARIADGILSPAIAALEKWGQPAQADEYPALVCDYCGALTPDPWHSSGMLHGKMSKHIHSCDACASRGQAPALTNLNCKSEQKRLATLWGFVPAQADSVREEAARYRWLRDGNDAKHGAAWHVAVNLYGCEWDAAIDAARKRGARHDR